MAFQLASLTALSFLWFARSVAQRSDFHIFVAFSLSWSLCLLSLPLGAYIFAVVVFDPLLSFRGFWEEGSGR